MTQRLYGFSVLAAVLAALTLGGLATAGQQVPFKGRSSGVVETTTCPDPPLNDTDFVCTIVDGEGEATHLGHFTVTAHVVVDLVADTVTGSWMLTAADGDVLFVTFVGFGIDPTHGGGNMTIMGGTGRFQGATGHYSQLITFSGTPGTLHGVSYTDVLEGTISSPGSNR
jgi:hypothetical protein